jgi:hypothetical protein
MPNNPIDLSKYGFSGVVVNPKSPSQPQPSVSSAPPVQQAAQLSKGSSQNTFINFLQSLPQAAADVVLKDAAKFVTSAGEGVAQTFKTGGTQSASGKTYNIPGISPFQSYQTEAIQRKAAGQGPVANAIQSTFDVAGGLGSTLALGEGVAEAPGIIKEQMTSKAVRETEQAALDSIKTKLSAGEQAEAAAKGKTTISGAAKQIVYAPSQEDTRIANVLKPLVKEGEVVSPKAPSDYLNNITAVQKELDSSTQTLRQGIQDSGGSWTPQDLTKEIFQTKVPLSIKATEGTVEKLQNAVFALVQDAPKTNEGLLDLRQNLDGMIRQEFPNLYDKESTPIRQYVRNIRETINDFTAKQLPDEKLPNGIGFRDELRRQSSLIAAREAMAQKISEELPENSTTLSRWAKANPQKAQLLKRIVYPLAIGAAIGGSAVSLGKALHNDVTGQ